MIVLLEHKTTSLLDYSTKSKVESVMIGSKATPDFESVVKATYDRNRSDSKPMVEPDLKSGEVLAFETEMAREAWLFWIDRGSGLQPLSKANMDLYTDLIIETHRYESEWIGQRMVEQDPVYKWLKNAPTTVPEPPTSSGGKYTFAK